MKKNKMTLSSLIEEPIVKRSGLRIIITEEQGKRLLKSLSQEKIEELNGKKDKNSKG